MLTVLPNTVHHIPRVVEIHENEKNIRCEQNRELGYSSMYCAHHIYPSIIDYSHIEKIILPCIIISNSIPNTNPLQSALIVKFELLLCLLMRPDNLVSFRDVRDVY